MSEIRSRTAVGTGDLGEMLGKEKSKQGKFSHWKNQSKGKFCEGKIKAKKTLYLQTLVFTG